MGRNQEVQKQTCQEEKEEIQATIVEVIREPAMLPPSARCTAHSQNHNACTRHAHRHTHQALPQTSIWGHKGQHVKIHQFQPQGSESSSWGSGCMKML